MKNWRLKLKLISFAYDFVSYLLYNTKKQPIRIILFGSVVRGNATTKSDIDIFIETKSNNQEEINEIVDKFYDSTKYKNYWKSLNVNNQIRPIVGTLEDYPSLKRSIISNSIILYSDYGEKIKGNNYSMFILEFSGKFSKKVSLWRKIYGYSQKINKKIYHSPGIIEKYGGKKITKGIFIVPITNGNNIIKELKKLKIKYKVFDISSDTL